MSLRISRPELAKGLNVQTLSTAESCIRSHVDANGKSVDWSGKPAHAVGGTMFQPTGMAGYWQLEPVQPPKHWHPPETETPPLRQTTPVTGDMVGEAVGDEVVVQTVALLSETASQHLVATLSVNPSPHLQTPVSTPVEEVTTPSDVPEPPPQINPLHTGATTAQPLPA